jgi:beta-galactosidase
MKNPLFSIFIMTALLLTQCHKSDHHRRILSLNGTWDLAVSDRLTDIPESFTCQVPVPGLVDMATARFDSIGTNKQSRYYWYRNKFTFPGDYPDKVLLKINKSRYGTWVYVNGKLRGKNFYCFTPTYMDIKEFLKERGEENELMIVVGSFSSLPDTIANGWDFEKTRYIPGIYDDVQLILADYPFIENIQVAPDIKNKKVKLQAYIDNSEYPQEYKVLYSVKESASGKTVANGSVKIPLKQKVHDTLNFEIKLESCHLWTPEDPFLYKLDISTPGDHFSTRFGMREFYFDTISRRAMLNGQPYYMRGTNVCIYRFFEDPSRNGLPWDRDWVRKLHETFKSMHWNSIRYCIGFPPEIWYEIADETGFLIQDEFPFWYLNSKEELAPALKARHLAAEYTAWMKERWNHPCVVIWDAQNETYTEETGKAIEMVRNLDLSGRPWDNGWSPPQKSSDVIETHPYAFYDYQYQPEGTALPQEGVMKNHFSVPRRPGNGPDGNNAIIINEYGWLWLNRDGSPTTLTDHIYATLFPEATTPAARFEVYARYLGMKTEYWRAHRQCAGVLHFCGLGYSRTEEPRGQTSDHFIDIQNLVLEPNFVKYVRPAFSPVGLMIDKWDIIYKQGEEIIIPVIIINDTYGDWNDTLTLSLLQDEKAIVEKSTKLNVEKLGQVKYEFSIKIPSEKGKYKMVAELEYMNEPVKSIRDFEVK